MSVAGAVAVTVANSKASAMLPEGRSVTAHKAGSASLNLLWALEGALTGLHWQVVAKEHRLSLLLALKALQKKEKN